MRAGKLRHRVTLMRPVGAATAVNDAGAPLEAFEEVRRVWASIEPLAGREGMSDRKVLAEATHEIRIRAAADLDVTWQILFGERVFRILDLRRPSERQAEVVLYTSEEVA